jgi:hypothetical protein
MRRLWKHVLGIALCAAVVFALFAIAVTSSFEGFSPDSAPTDQQRLISARGDAMLDVLLFPTRWLLEEPNMSAVASGVIWTGLLYLSVYGAGKLVYGLFRKSVV